MNTARMLAVLLALLAAPAAGAGVVVVTSPQTQLDRLDTQQVTQVFLGRALSLPDGSRVVPVDQVEGSPVREAFVTRVLGRTEQQLRGYWSRQIFTGKGQPPRTVASDADVLRLVLANPGYVGYVDSNGLTPAVKVLYRLD